MCQVTNQPIFRVFMVDKCEKTVKIMVLAQYLKLVLLFCTTTIDEKVGSTILKPRIIRENFPKTFHI